MGLSIRDSVAGDMAEITAIYGYFVTTSTASFETMPPGPDEMTRRREGLLAEGYPYLVAVDDDTGRVLGYAYAGAYRTRPAYRFTCENSVYVATDAHGRGVARALMQALIDRAEAFGARQMVAVIGDRANHASIALHAACGFEHAGVLPAVGWKFGRWIDVVLMTRPLGAGANSPPEDSA